VIVRVIVMGGVSCGGCHFQILPCNPSKDLLGRLAPVICDGA
jgi:hypothetical protein